MPLTKELIDTCKPFNCGDDELDDFFNLDSPHYAIAMLSKSYCYVLDDDPKTIVCAFSLSNESVRTDLLPNQRHKNFMKQFPHEKRMRRYPAVLIGRLGVNRDFAHKGIGTELMEFIKSWVTLPEYVTACRYLAVDALNNQQTLSFYEKNGFHSFFKSEEQEAEKVRLKLPLKTRYLYFDLINII